MTTTMSETPDLVITVQKREAQGGSTGQRLRREGRIPAVVYGSDKAPYPISIDRETFDILMRQETGENTIFLLKLEGTTEERRAMIKELQRDPMTGAPLHIDFIRVVKGHKLNVEIPIELEGDCIGVRHGGRVDFVSRELKVEILPREMFDKLTVDVSKLDLGHQVTVADLAPMLPPSARFLEDPSRTVVVVEGPRGAADDEEEVATPPVRETDEPAEPQVIRKGHETDE
jgi:large subunit ribosomal protein L25